MVIRVPEHENECMCVQSYIAMLHDFVSRNYNARLTFITEGHFGYLYL